MDYLSIKLKQTRPEMTQTSQWPVPKDSIRYVVPEPIIRLLASHPLTRDLYPLAFGHYRRAVGHHMHREHHHDNLLIYCTRVPRYQSTYRLYQNCKGYSSTYQYCIKAPPADHGQHQNGRAGDGLAWSAGNDSGLDPQFQTEL